MSIDAKSLVDIQSRVITAGLTGIEMNSVFLSQSSSIPANIPVSFTNSDSVGDYFGRTSNEYALSVNYFLADDNKQKNPSALYFYRFISDAVAGWLRGGNVQTVSSVASIAAITDGSLKLSIDGVEKEYTGIDFSGIVSYSQVASTIQTAMNGDATVEYDANFKAFVITSSTTGENSSVGYAVEPETGTDLSSILSLNADNALISAGSDAKEPSDNMVDLLKQLKNFVSFMSVFDEDNETRLALAQWCNSQGTRFVYLANDTSANALTPNNDNCFAKQVKDYFGVFCGYNTKEFLAFVAGFIAAIDWSRANGRKTLAYKSQAGLGPTVTEDSQATALLSNGYNFYGAYATASEEFSLAQNGSISGKAKWLDTYLGQIWVKTSLQASWLAVEINSNVLPYNDRGYDKFYAGSLDTINAAKEAGIIVAGVTLSNAQKVQVASEAGQDISDALFTQGWYLQIPDADATTRANREAIKPNFWYCDGGSIQKVQGNSNTIL